MSLLQYIHSPSKYLVWVKKCRHVWLDQNFDPSLLTKNFNLFSWEWSRKIFFFLNTYQNGRLKKEFFFAFFPWKLVKVYWLARMGQNFDQAKRDNTFWPTPNILGGSVLLEKPPVFEKVTENKHEVQIWKIRYRCMRRHCAVVAVPSMLAEQVYHYVHMGRSEHTTALNTLPPRMFGVGQKVLSRLAWSKFWAILANQ